MRNQPPVIREIEFDEEEEKTAVTDVWQPSPSMIPKPALGLVYVLHVLPPWTRALVVLAVIALLAYMTSRGVGLI
jgi:hypothetical protein